MELFAVKSPYTGELVVVNVGPKDWDQSIATLHVNTFIPGQTLETVLALAHQFAAAPMMVEALKAVLADDEDNVCCSFGSNTLDLIKAALAKAEPPLPDGSEFPVADAEVAL